MLRRSRRPRRPARGHSPNPASTRQASEARRTRDSLSHPTLLNAANDREIMPLGNERNDEAQASSPVLVRRSNHHRDSDRCGNASRDDNGSARSRHLASLAGQPGNAGRAGGPPAPVLDHCDLQERPVSRCGPLPEAPERRARFVDMEGWDADDAGTVADQSLLR
jgi:hypothetical protein